MARYNEILVGRFNRGLQKLLGMKGEAPAPQLSTEIMTVLPLQLGAEYRYLDGWNRFGFVANGDAGAGLNALVQLRNPSSVNVISVIERVEVNNIAAATTVSFNLGALATDLANPTPINARMDPRGNPQSSMKASHASGAAPGTPTLAFANVAALANYELLLTFAQEIPLLPGDTFSVVNNTLNQQTTVTVWWRERFLEESERS